MKIRVDWIQAKGKIAPSFCLQLLLFGFLFLTHSELLHAQPQKENLKVGVILPLTGPVAEYGVAIQRGFSMAKADNPELSSSLEFLFEDSKYDSKAAVSNFKKLTELDRVDLIYVFGGPMSEVLAPLADAAKVPTLLSAYEPKVVYGKKYSIRFCNPANDYGAVLGKWLEKRGAKRIALIRTENQYLIAMQNGLESALPKTTGLTLLDSVGYDTQDFKTDVSKLKRKQYDAVGVYMLNGQVSSFLKTLKQQQIQLPIFGTDFFESRSEIAQAEGMMEGAVFPNNSVSKDFSDRYKTAYGNDSQITWAGFGYDAVLLMIQVLKNGKGSTPELMMEKLKAVGEYEGVMGRQKYIRTEAGDSYFGTPVVLKVIEGSEFHVLSSSELAK